MCRTIIITGASDGIGAAAARKLHAQGNQVIVVGRNPEKTRAVANSIGADFFVADFARLEEVRDLAAKLDKAYPHIDVLANNAGGIFGDPTKTVDGFEITFQVNHLAPFLLTQLLMDKLIANKASIIQTSSTGAWLSGKLIMDDLQHDKDFSTQLVYGTSKLANIMFTKELHRRYHKLGISAAAFHPGVIASNFAAESESFIKYISNTWFARAFLATPDKGADQLVWLASSKPDVNWASGTYYEKRKPAKRNNPQIFDEDLAIQLWDKTEQLLA